MSLPPDLQKVLPRATQVAWEKIIPAVPENAYLADGTALAVHLKHRESRDLDFFITGAIAPSELEEHLHRLGRFAATLITSDTLNGVFEEAKVQFLDATSQRVLEPFQHVGGLKIAGLGDLLATKLKVIGDRGELRDYFDVWRLEVDAHRSVEEGLELFVQRYAPKTPDAAIAHIVRALGYLDDVADDPFLPVDRKTLTRYWQQRQPELIRHLGYATWAPATNRRRGRKQ